MGIVGESGSYFVIKEREGQEGVASQVVGRVISQVVVQGCEYLRIVGILVYVNIQNILELLYGFDWYEYC